MTTTSAEVRMNTLYVLTPGSYLRGDHQTIKVMVDRKAKLTVPVHHLDGIVIFGRTLLSTGLVKLCTEAGVMISFLSEKGRFLAGVNSGSQGNVLLRRQQFRLADQPDFALKLARAFTAGKIRNSRNCLVRAARETEVPEDAQGLRDAAAELAFTLEALPNIKDLDTLRGYEGEAAKAYFKGLGLMVKRCGAEFAFTQRTRRPPRDPVNAMMSFTYSVLVHDVASALAAVGLDPYVGYLHADRPGKPSLALDLMEEFRAILADRLVVTLINRRQVGPDDFVTHAGGVVEMSEKARKTLLLTYQQRKKQPIRHPVLEQDVTLGELPVLQAKILARHIRGDVQDYVPCVLR